MEREKCKERIIVTMTSWTERVKRNITKTIFSILEGTLMPDDFYLTLSAEEWKNADEESRAEYEDLKKISLVYPNFHVFMVSGPNTKAFKKLLPVMELHKEEPCIFITIDDDMMYPSNFVELMVKKYSEDTSRPVTASYFQRNGMLFMWGGAALYTHEHLKGYEYLLDDEIMSTYEDDWFYTYVLLMNCIKPVIAPNEIYYSPSKYTQTIYDVQMYSGDVYRSFDTEAILNRKLEDKGTSFNELCDRIFEKYGNSL